MVVCRAHLQASTHTSLTHPSHLQECFIQASYFFFQSDANIQQQHTVCRVNLVNLDRKLAGEVSFITIIVPRIVARSNSTFAFSLSRSHIGAKTKKQFRRKVKTLVDFVSRLKLVSLVGKYTEVGEDTKTKRNTTRSEKSGRHKSERDSCVITYIYI